MTSSEKITYLNDHHYKVLNRFTNIYMKECRENIWQYAMYVYDIPSEKVIVYQTPFPDLGQDQIDLGIIMGNDAFNICSSKKSAKKYVNKMLKSTLAQLLYETK